MPEASVEFVDSVGLVMETIDGEGGAGYVVLTTITHVLKVMALRWMRMIGVGACHHVVSFQVFVAELIQGLPTESVITPG